MKLRDGRDVDADYFGVRIFACEPGCQDASSAADVQDPFGIGHGSVEGFAVHQSDQGLRLGVETVVLLGTNEVISLV